MIEATLLTVLAALLAMIASIGLPLLLTPPEDPRGRWVLLFPLAIVLQCRCLSVAPSMAALTSGEDRHLVALKVRFRRWMVRITLVDGSRLYLSPADGGGLLKALNG